MRPSLRGVVWFAWGVVGLLIAAVVVVGLYGVPERTPAASRHQRLRRTAPRVTVRRRRPPPASRGATPPSFDIVSVDRSGHAVIAGRAAPGDRVRVLDGDTPIGEVSADSRGEWVLVPEAPIAPGDRQLGVEATGPHGGPRPPLARCRRAVGGAARIRRQGGGTSTLAVLLPGEPGAPARILQRPQDPAG